MRRAARRSLEADGLVAEADGNRTRLSRVAAHTGFEDSNSSTNVGIDSKAAGKKTILSNIGENLALLHNRSNGDSVPATVPEHILTMEPPGTAVRTAISAGHARP